MFNTKEIYNKFSTTKLKDTIRNEVSLEHQSFIFDDTMPIQNKKEKKTYDYSQMFDSFYIEEKNKNYPKHKAKPKGNVVSNNQNSFNQNEWRGKYQTISVLSNSNNESHNLNNNCIINENSDTNKGLKVYKHLLEMTSEDNFNIENSYIYVNESNKRHKNHNPNEKNDFELNYETIFTKDIKEELDSKPVLSVDYKNNYNFSNPTGKNVYFTPVDFKMIYKINEKLKYPKNDPLWYTYHIIAKSSFGPVSSTQLEEMYYNKNIDGLTDVRLIDIFKLKNKGPFAYFKLKDVENSNFLKDNIDGSNLIKYVDELNKIKKEESFKVEIKNTKTNKVTKTEVKEPIKTKIVYYDEMYQDKVEDFNRENEKIPNQAYYHEKVNINIPKAIIKSKNEPKLENMVFIKNTESIIDKELNEKELNNPKKKAGKKKGKGKLVELEAKTGFFTLSEQEKNYEPIYICGDIDNNK